MKYFVLVRKGEFWDIYRNLPMELWEATQCKKRLEAWIEIAEVKIVGDIREFLEEKIDTEKLTDKMKHKIESWLTELEGED